MRDDEIVSLLRRIPLLGGWDEEGLRALVEACPVRSVAAGSVLLTPNDPAERFFVILQGGVKLYQLSPAGEQQIVHQYAPGDTFGEAAMWTGGTYPVFAEATDATVVLAVGRSLLRRLLSEDVERAFRMLAGLSSKLREFAALIEDLSLRDVPGRLSRRLLELSRDRAGGTFRLPVSKRDLAAQLGTTPESLSRALGRFRQAGWIDVRGPAVTVRDRAALRALADQ